MMIDYLFFLCTTIFQLLVFSACFSESCFITFYEAKSYVNSFNPCKSALIRVSNFGVYSCPFVPTCRDFLVAATPRQVFSGFSVQLRLGEPLAAGVAFGVAGSPRRVSSVVLKNR